jgi:hypothetical protein
MLLVTNINRHPKNIPKLVIGKENVFKKNSMWFMENQLSKITKIITQVNFLNMKKITLEKFECILKLNYSFYGVLFLILILILQWIFFGPHFSFCVYDKHRFVIISKVHNIESNLNFLKLIHNFNMYSSIDLTLELIVHLDIGCFGQFFMIKTSFSKFSMPRWKCFNPLIIPTILKILSISFCELTIHNL